MSDIPHLIFDLALILLIATPITLILKKFSLPLIFGYLLAGFLAGPHMSLFPNTLDNESLHIWAEIGVILLLFNLGLDFSFKKIIRLGPAPLLAALIEVSLLFGLGFAVGRFMGWTIVQSFFVGGIVCFSSTTIFIKSIQDLNLLHTKFSQFVVSLLIVEDLGAIILLAVLSSISINNTIEGITYMRLTLRFIAFIICFYLLGLIFIPPVLKKLRRLMNDEVILLVSLALCFGSVMFASRIGFSSALGAFLMGSVLSETFYREKIHDLLKSLKELFVMIFFVSIGTYLNLNAFTGNWLLLIILLLLATLGRNIITALAALLSGQTLQRSIEVGTSLGQIGEFSFVIITLGYKLNILSETFFSLVVVICLISSFTTPLMIRSRKIISTTICNLLPAVVLEKLTAYSFFIQNVSPMNRWSPTLWKNSFKKISSHLYQQRPQIIPWDAHVYQLRIPSEYSGIGSTISELALRKNFGITIAMITRGFNNILAPKAKERIYPNDTLFIVGSEDQFLNFQNSIHTSDPEMAPNTTNVQLKSILIDASSSFLHKSLQEINIGVENQLLIVAVERKTARIISPSGDFILKENDIVWVLTQS